MSKYDRLNQVVAEGILALDTFTESLNNFIQVLEEKSKVEHCHGAVHSLKEQNHSLLTTLSVIKNIKKKSLTY